MHKDLPVAYAWLRGEPGPKMLVEALRHYGLEETAGPANNPEIMAWADQLGAKSIFLGDSVPWCGLFMAWVADQSSKPLPANWWAAKSWASWGEASPKPALGDVLVFRRKGGHHVGQYVAEDAVAYYVLGGNQGDSVSIVRIPKDRLIAARRSYHVTPANVRSIWLPAIGGLSHNEA